jgi:hypothetical protein
MRKYILTGAGTLLVAISLFTISWTPTAALSPANNTLKTSAVRTLSEASLYDQYIQTLYSDIHLAGSGLNVAVFEKAVTGYYNLKNSGKLSRGKSVISIADMDQASTSKRLWVIDLDKKAVILNTWVAHGKNTGDDKATRFSNVNSSNQSSLGFYVTGEVYYGKHGRSLRLDGMDAGYNSNARQRAIVVHGASYVGQGTINALGRLGRSQGCPAVAPEFADKLISTIEGKTVLFINGTDQSYTSRYLDIDAAASFAALPSHSATTDAELALAKSLQVGI